jgi:aquaporin NIP
LHEEIPGGVPGYLPPGFCGTGAIVINELSGGILTLPGISLVFGLVVASVILVMGDQSGAHINPAVTLAFFINKSLPAKQATSYIINQLAGGVTASFLLQFLFPSSNPLGSTASSVSTLQLFVWEGTLSFILMLVILGVSQRGKITGIPAAISVGTVIMLETFFALPLTGASMNPARSLAPALITGTWTDLWIYLLAPVAGMTLAVATWRLMHKQNIFTR